MPEKTNIIANKSKAFAIRIIHFSKYLTTQKNEYIISKQIFRSGTSIGANVCEATRAQSRNDFIAKMNIALKESYETEYWLRLLNRTNYISDTEFKSIYTENQDITNVIAKILVTSKNTSNE